MAARINSVELTTYTGVHQGSLTPLATQTGSFGGRLYQRLFCGGAISKCFEKAKRCVAAVYGPPYPPLSADKVKENYSIATLCILMGTLFGGLTLFMIVVEATDPSPKSSIPLEAAMPIFSIMEALCVSVGVAGFIIAKKTRNAPRIEELRALLH